MGPPRLGGEPADRVLVVVFGRTTGEVVGGETELLALDAGGHVRSHAVVVAGQLVVGHALEKPRFFARRA